MYFPSRQRVNRALVVIVSVCSLVMVAFIANLHFPKLQHNTEERPEELASTSLVKDLLKEERDGNSRVIGPGNLELHPDVNTSFLAPPNIQEAVRETFQPINGQGMYAYSAYFDTTTKGVQVIQVIGIGQRGPTIVEIYCHLFELGRVEITTGEMKSFSNSNIKVANFTGKYFECRLQPGSRPQFVSLTTHVKEQPTNKLEVVYPGRRVRNITVCHPAMFGPYNATSQLIQSIEINRALGADHIFVYNYSVSHETNLVLRQYQADGVLTVLQWALPKDTWYYSQNAAINDCLHRNKNVSQYVVIIDLDEFIIPVRSTSWGDLIQNINSDYYDHDKVDKPPLGSMVFKSCLFYRKPSNDVWKEMAAKFSITKEEERFINQNVVLPFLYLDRSSPPFSFPKRSKAINRPDLVSIASIHHIKKHKKNAREYLVSSDKAIVIHFSESRMKIARTVTDSSFLKLKKKLIPRLQQAFSRFLKILHVQQISHRKY